MKRVFSALVLLAVWSVSFSAKADSPVTSTAFSEVYYDEAIVLKAQGAAGVLNDELMAYLYEKTNPVDVKLAIINELSWDYNGKNNFDLFVQFCLTASGSESSDKLIKKAKGDLLICLAYLKAMDNYFVVGEAYDLAKKARTKGKKSYCIHLIAGVIEGQYLFDSDWCGVFKATDKVRNNKKLKTDIRSEAINIVFEYMDLYAESCVNDAD
jgi:hypothetical protein